MLHYSLCTLATSRFHYSTGSAARQFLMSSALLYLFSVQAVYSLPAVHFECALPFLQLPDVISKFSKFYFSYSNRISSIYGDNILGAHSRPVGQGDFLFVHLSPLGDRKIQSLKRVYLSLTLVKPYPFELSLV